MARAEKVSYWRGKHATIPSGGISGRIMMEEDTGDCFLEFNSFNAATGAWEVARKQLTDNRKFNISGGLYTGPVVLAMQPEEAQEIIENSEDLEIQGWPIPQIAATKLYVDKVQDNLQDHADDTFLHLGMHDGETTERSYWNQKVDSEEGKGLSTNDFTNAYRDKLDNIADDADDVNFEPIQLEGNAIGKITINDIEYIIYSPIPTELHGNADTASKLEISKLIDGVEFDGSKDITHYGVCNTSGVESVKQVSIDGFELQDGSSAYVYFLNDDDLNPDAAPLNLDEVLERDYPECTNITSYFDISYSKIPGPNKLTPGTFRLSHFTMYKAIFSLMIDEITLEADNLYNLSYEDFPVIDISPIPDYLKGVLIFSVSSNIVLDSSDGSHVPSIEIDYSEVEQSYSGVIVDANNSLHEISTISFIPDEQYDPDDYPEFVTTRMNANFDRSSLPDDLSYSDLFALKFSSQFSPSSDVPSNDLRYVVFTLPETIDIESEEAGEATQVQLDWDNFYKIEYSYSNRNSICYVIVDNQQYELDLNTNFVYSEAPNGYYGRGFLEAGASFVNHEDELPSTIHVDPEDGTTIYIEEDEYFRDAKLWVRTSVQEDVNKWYTINLFLKEYTHGEYESGDYISEEITYKYRQESDKVFFTLFSSSFDINWQISYIDPSDVLYLDINNIPKIVYYNGENLKRGLLKSNCYHFVYNETYDNYQLVGSMGEVYRNVNYEQAGLMTPSDKQSLDNMKIKLEGIEEGANHTYPASDSQFGGVIVGDNISVEQDGTISLNFENITNALGYVPSETTITPDELIDTIGVFEGVHEIDPLISGKVGLVPEPFYLSRDYNKYLRGDGTWSSVPDPKALSVDEILEICEITAVDEDVSTYFNIVEESESHIVFNLDLNRNYWHYLSDNNVLPPKLENWGTDTLEFWLMQDGGLTLYPNNLYGVGYADNNFDFIPSMPCFKGYFLFEVNQVIELKRLVDTSSYTIAIHYDSNSQQYTTTILDKNDEPHSVDVTFIPKDEFDPHNYTEAVKLHLQPGVNYKLRSTYSNRSGYVEFRVGSDIVFEWSPGDEYTSYDYQIYVRNLNSRLGTCDVIVAYPPDVEVTFNSANFKLD